MPARTFVTFLILLFSVSAQQTERDLKIEKKAQKPAPPAAVQTTPKPAEVSIPRSYALVVGIAKYANLETGKQLYFSERDAQSIYSILISTEGGRFPAENVHRLIGPEATLSRLRYELEEWLPAAAKENDRVLIYFAGHGFVTQGRAYLAPYDIDPENVDGTGYPMAALGGAIGNKIKAKSKILLTDACHSGAIRFEEDLQSMNRTLIDLGKSLFSLTASRDREQSFESPVWGEGHGIFTYYVVRGMEGEADEDGDGIITADELQDYVRRNVRDVTEGKQNPTSDRGSFDPEMLLAYVPSRAKSASAPSQKYGTLIFESNLDGVEILLDDKSIGVTNKGKPLPMPGLMPGPHKVKAIKMGFEPDGPREEMVYPGQERTVSIQILIPRRRKAAAGKALDQGIALYEKGYAKNYREAEKEFHKALDIDPTYSQAALYLGRVYNALSDEKNAEKYFRKAIEIDPDYLEAVASYASMLLDIGNLDEAVRQFNVVLQREPNDVMALTNLAQAYLRKKMYQPSIQSAQKAIALRPQYAEPHLCLADAFRFMNRFEASKTEYREYLRLSDFDSGQVAKLNFYLFSFVTGIPAKKKHAAQQDIWKELRNQAYFGICDCEYRLNQFDRAIGDCRRALEYDQLDPYTHFDLARALTQQANRTTSDAVSQEMLKEARKHFDKVLQINPDIDEADYARRNLAQIEKALQ